MLEVMGHEIGFRGRIRSRARGRALGFKIQGLGVNGWGLVLGVRGKGYG